MNVKKMIKIFYIGYTIYILMVISSTSLSFSLVFPSIMLMWVNYFLFSLGYFFNKGSRVIKLNDPFSRFWKSKRNYFYLTIISISSAFFSVIVVRFYTGQTPITILRNLFNGNSLYYLYQSYFFENQINVFSFKKIPYILMLFFIKFILFYSYVSLLILKDKITKFERFYLALITLSYIYVGIARGTNFEFFEILLIVIYVILSKHNLKKIQIPLKPLSKVLILVIIMIIVFYFRVKARGVNFNFYISRDVFYDPNGFLSLLFPILSFFTVVIYGYFGFGFYYMSKYISDIWFSSFDNLIAGFLPFGFYATKSKAITDIMKNVVDIGARWHPDSILFINNFGYIGLLLFCFWLGFFTKYINNSKIKSSIIYLTNFMIFMQMISLPVGNFILASSSNILIVIFLFSLYLEKLYYKY